MKSSFKKGIAITVLILVCGLYAGYRYYIGTHYSDIYGGVEPAEMQEDESFTVTGGAVSYTVFNVGQGEAILIKCGETEALIDTGTKKSAKALCKALDKTVSGDIEYLVLTSPSDGRLGGLGRLLDNFKVGSCIVGDMGEKREKVMDALDGMTTAVEAEELSYDLGSGATLFVIKTEAPGGESGSLATYLAFGGTGFVALSDAGEEAVKKVFGSVGACDVVVLAGNGDIESNWAIPEGLGIKYLVVSADEEHTTDMTDMESYLQASSYATSLNGKIEFVSAGEDVELVQQNQEDAG